jgi:subtilisin-like proprotein convertase family protein
MVDLGALGADSNSSWADGINDFGQIVGFSYIDGTTRHPCLWEKVGGDWRITDLGALAGSNSYAVSFNDFGQVVGHGTSAWLYDGVMHDLNDLIPVGSGWYLRKAMAINDQGQIVGFGPNPTGAIHGFLLNPTYSYTSAGSAVAIKDNAPTSQAMTLTDAYLISDLNVTVNLTHARYADLKIELKGPEDSACQLLCNAGGLQGSGTKTIVFDDDGAAGTIPCQLLRGYEGKNIRGTWTLRVTDTVKNNKTGTLNSWALTEVPGTP